MRSAILVALAAMATASPARRGKGAYKPLVTSDALKADIKVGNLMAGAQILQGFADSHSNGTHLNSTRSIGTPGHLDTIQWIKNELDATGYYNVELQTFDARIQLSSEVKTFSIDGENVEGIILDYSPSASVTAELVHVSNQGCNASDYPPSVARKIVLVSRGPCFFGIKSALAGSAGAAAVIVYNNVPGITDGTLGGQPRAEGPYVATLSISQELGKKTADAIDGGANITATIDITTDIRNVSTTNLIATTKTGDQDNKLSVGGHTDSVPEGPGLNDNGSGTVALVEIAKALSNYSINNAVMFGFWSAEEWGLLGSQHYVETLPATELAKIRTYLNFDVLASKNYMLGVYDGIGTFSNATFPPGSADIQSLFVSYFNSSSLPCVLVDAIGTSDQASFQNVGVPVGGLYTGGPNNKTELEVELFGGKLGVPRDPCNHQACDTVDNLNVEVWELMAKGAAHAVATYAADWGKFPKRSTAPARAKKAKRAGKMVHE